MRILYTLMFFLAISPSFAQNTGKYTSIDLDIVNVQDRLNLSKNSVYNRTLSYYSKPFGDRHGRSTNVHETIHGINSSLSNTRRGYRAFYIGYGKAVWIKEPKIKMVDIIEYIPNSVKGYRFKTYFISQIKSWNDVALYPMDEWVAYLGGAECAVNDYENNISIETNTDAVSGSLEFSIYCVALAMSVREKDNKYWNEYKNFHNAIRLLLNRSESVFFKGKDIFRSEKQEKLLENFRSSPDCKKMRNFISQEFNGVFIQ